MFLSLKEQILLIAILSCSFILYWISKQPNITVYIWPYMLYCLFWILLLKLSYRKYIFKPSNSMGIDQYSQLKYTYAVHNNMITEIYVRDKNELLSWRELDYSLTIKMPATYDDFNLFVKHNSVMWQLVSTIKKNINRDPYKHKHMVSEYNTNNLIIYGLYVIIAFISLVYLIDNVLK